MGQDREYCLTCFGLVGLWITMDIPFPSPKTPTSSRGSKLSIKTLTLLHPSTIPTHVLSLSLFSRLLSPDITLSLTLTILSLCCSVPLWQWFTCRMCGLMARHFLSLYFQCRRRGRGSPTRPSLMKNSICLSNMVHLQFSDFF